MKQIECMIRGRVQMVMMRDFVQRKARRLGLVGTVQNLSDGSVRIVAQGEKEVLERFIERVRRGSILSRVDSVAVVWSEVEQKFDGFVIVY